MMMIKKPFCMLSAAVLALSLAACSSGNTDASGTTTSVGGATAVPTTLVGPGCADYLAQVPAGAGSIEAMAKDSVGTAIANNPLLMTSYAAVSGQLNPGVNLIDDLNSGEVTVFAPVDSAWAKVVPAAMTALSTSDRALTQFLTYHVVPGRLAPDEIVGTHTTVQGGELTVTESGDALVVLGAGGAPTAPDGSQIPNQAGVICGGIETENGTVYLIDQVLSPPVG